MGTVGESVTGGLIGGAIVFIGVLVAEALGRLRSRQERLEETMWTLQLESSGLMGGPMGGQYDPQTVARLMQFSSRVNRIAHLAHWVRHAKAIRTEANEVQKRWAVAMIGWIQGGPPPRLGPIMQARLGNLILGSKGSLDELVNPALREQGLPTIDDLMADDPDWTPPSNQ
jgi:hypothetical protein